MPKKEKREEKKEEEEERNPTYIYMSQLLGESGAV